MHFFVFKEKKSRLRDYKQRAHVHVARKYFALNPCGQHLS